MAVTAELQTSRLSLVLEDGIDPESGDQLYRTKSFNNIKIDATPEQLHTFASALIPLQQRQIDTVELTQNSMLSETEA